MQLIEADISHDAGVMCLLDDSCDYICDDDCVDAQSLEWISDLIATTLVIEGSDDSDDLETLHYWHGHPLSDVAIRRELCGAGTIAACEIGLDATSTGIDATSETAVAESTAVTSLDIPANEFDDMSQFCDM